MLFVKETSPHIRRKDSLRMMLLNVIIALAPVAIWAYIVYPLSALRILPLSVATCVLCEFLFVLITKKDPKAFTLENILSSVVTGLIYGLCLPPSLSWDNGVGYFVVVFGAAFGITIGKLVFGGIGSNIFNPAALGMIVVRIFWSSICKSDAGALGFIIMEPFDTSISVGATALSYPASLYGSVNMLDLFLGRVPGALGETFHIAILAGLVYLLVTRTIDWRVFVSYMGTFITLGLAAGIVALNKVGTNPLYFAAYQLLSGGVLFGAVFMVTDPVTGPIASPTRFIYGAFAAIMAAIIRLLGSYNEGVGLGVLLANMFACVLDNPKFSASRWNKKHLIVLGSEIGVALLIVVLTLCFKEGALK
ncbi:MAG: RnfABCDGE type electron transport complex subunit D [Bacilli bacterium]|nr:RnfABCDGE type electron transport complex subunit D [Bacilli bacterium]